MSGERSHFTGRQWGAGLASAGKRPGSHSSGRRASRFEAGLVRRGSEWGEEPSGHHCHCPGEIRRARPGRRRAEEAFRHIPEADWTEHGN